MAEKSVQKLYNKARQCIDEDHKNDPKTEPFKSLYAGSEHLSNALNNLKNRADKSELAQLAQAQILYELGRIDADTEEAGGGQKFLKSALEILSSLKDDIVPRKTILHLSVLNQLAIVDSSRNDMEEAMEKLKKAETMYNAIRDKFETDEILDTQEHHLEYLVGNKDDLPRLLKYSLWIEEEGTKTKYYLAQCYQHMGDKQKAAMYCHITLKKQLKNKDFLSFFDPVDWAVNAATLSQFFLYLDNFNLAMHLLACADYMIKTTRPTVEPDDLERVQWRGADIDRCWIKFCTVLLERSKEIKQQLEDGKPIEIPENMPVLVKLIDNDDITATENEVKSSIAQNFEEARRVFLLGQRKLADATKYYGLNERASDYILITQDSSKLYRDLVAFEPQVDRKCKMHKRRIDLLETMVKALNPKFYGGELQQIHFELAEVYSEIMDLKYASLPQGMLKATDSHVAKINMLVKKGIHNYQTFLELIKDFEVKGSAGADGIGKYEDSYVRPALVARFSIGRLESKYIVGHPRQKIENLEKSKKHYEFVENYIKKYPDHEKFIAGELEVMRELAAILPQTIQNLISNTVF